MSSETHNTQAGKDQRGSSNPNMKLQKQEERDPNARDRENRKGGDNPENR